MNPVELEQLAPYFKQGEKYANGQLIDWSTVNFQTMQQAWKLRALWGKPIIVIRGPHPQRVEAVDFEAANVPLRDIAPDILRVNLGGVGLYSAGSFHLDSRPLAQAELPARWLAVRPDEEKFLDMEKLDHLIVDRKPDWLYLRWSSSDWVRALDLVLKLSDLNNPKPTLPVVSV